MLLKLFLLFVLSCSLGATEYLKSNYFVTTDFIQLSDIVKNPKKDFILYKLEANKHIKRVKASQLLKKLKQHGYKEYLSKHSYIQFNKKSPINTDTIRQRLIEHYKQKYKSIQIKSLMLEPRSYRESLPTEYSFGIDEKEYLSNKGHCFVITPQKKKIFFNYEFFASVDVYHARKNISRGEELSRFNLKKKSIMLNRFRASPLESLQTGKYEAKHRIKNGNIVTSRDIIGLYLVKRGATVTVTLKNKGINISFSAQALTSGRDGELITVLKSNNKKIKVRVNGKNRAEM